MSDLRDFTGKNRKFTGIIGEKISTGTTGQRDTSFGGGTLRFNSTTNLMEYYTGTEWKSIDAPPSITTFTINGGSNISSGNIVKDSSITTVGINGSLFDTTGATVLFVGNGGGDVSPLTTTRNSANLITVTVSGNSFSNTYEPYDIKIINGSGLFATLENCINSDSLPAFTNTAGNLATITDIATGTHATVQATDADSDTVSYAVTTGALPGGLSLNASTGVISGDPDNVASSTTTNFSITATANSQTSVRAFNIIVTPYADGTTTARAIPTTQTVGETYTAVGYTGQQLLYIKDATGNNIQTYTYKDTNGNSWFLMAGIGDYNSGSSLDNWNNKGSWKGTNIFGSAATANLDYKNRLWFDRTYPDFLCMQGTTSSNISADFYGNSSEVAHTTGNYLTASSRGSKLSTMLGGNGGPDLASGGNSNNTQTPVTFLKGTAAASEARYGPDPQGEMGTPNVIHWGIQNCESYRYAAVNALGCNNASSCNVEHYAWSADAGVDYRASNFPGTNYSAPWNQSFAFLYWLFWGRSG